MDIINKILLEWRYQLPAGYPQTDSDYHKLGEVLSEMTDLDVASIQRIVEHARTGNIISEQEDMNIREYENFQNFILNVYAMDGQQLLGLDKLFQSIIDHTNRDKLFGLINDTTKKSLTSGTYDITGTDLDLYNLIMQNVRVPNGHPSELWFAIKFNGEVKGGVAGDSIVSDIDVGADGVSLKDYAKISTVDFGSLTADAAKLLKSSVSVFELLSGQAINKSMTRDSINSILNMLDSEELHNDIKKLISVANDTDIRVIQRFINKLQVFMPSGDPTDIVEYFCTELNQTIRQKLTEVDWWGIINNGKLYLETSNEMYHALKCKNNRIAMAVNNFKGMHLFVNGNTINAEIQNLRTQEQG